MKKITTMKKASKKAIWIIFGISILVSLLLAPIRGYEIIPNFSGFKTSSIAFFIVYFSFALWMLRRYPASSKYVFWAIVAGALLIDIPLRIIYPVSTLISLPEFLIRAFAVLAAWFVFKARTKALRITITLAACCAVLCVVFYVYM